MIRNCYGNIWQHIMALHHGFLHRFLRLDVKHRRCRNADKVSSQQKMQNYPLLWNPKNNTDATNYKKEQMFKAEWSQSTRWAQYKIHPPDFSEKVKGASDRKVTQRPKRTRSMVVLESSYRDRADWAWQCVY